MDELQHERSSSYNALTTRKKVATDDAKEQISFCIPNARLWRLTSPGH
jgi:hypothetical protein